MRRGRPAAAGVFGGLLMFAASGCGAWQVKPECRTAYDACVDGCGARCGDRGGGSGAHTSGPDMTDTWTQGCSACEQACRDTRDRCNR
jgi:hypothetical protein